MKKWYAEYWNFKIEVLRVGSENLPTACRLGLEPGDIFECTYETPAGFCPTSFIKIFPGMEVVRGGGDLRNLGGKGPGEIDFLCPDGVVFFKLSTEKFAQSRSHTQHKDS
jgi:uncharacterized repeat protein (TIGR04076 family)